MVDVTTTTRPGLPDLVEVDAYGTGSFKTNDFIVTTESAAEYSVYQNIDGWHHTNVQSEANGGDIAVDAQQPGLIDWRLK